MCLALHDILCLRKKPKVFNSEENAYHRSDPHKKKFKYPRSSDVFSRENELVVTLQPKQTFAKVSASVIDFNAPAPLDHAADPANQKMAKIVVNIKSCGNESKKVRQFSMESR